MGGILLIMTLIAVYILCYWSIAIETLSDKTFGFLGFHNIKSHTFHQKVIIKSSYRRKNENPPVSVAPPIEKTKKAYIKNGKINLTRKKQFSFYKKS